MTDELDTLRPEVRRADSFLDSMACTVDEEAAVKTIRAELLRLAADNCGMHKALCEHDELCEQLTAMRLRTEKAEAELAALKARIGEAPVGVVNVDDRGCEFVSVDFAENTRVRLVVEE